MQLSINNTMQGSNVIDSVSTPEIHGSMGKQPVPEFTFGETSARLKHNFTSFLRHS